ncbi:hypothetical protein D9756_001223 [Leucocoprinus leucothites]|uniref:NACHT domain-containing protein n=1 Tax=Leucocoprinus leucothites TaxID=201217 RepID=A0A8H5G3U2_9AGAR|nr:hypothetical protein D9756_001223 [Leucoagaricus leucothites]
MTEGASTGEGGSSQRPAVLGTVPNLSSLPETLRREDLVEVLQPLLARIELLEAQIQELQAARHVHALKLGLLGQGPHLMGPSTSLRTNTSARSSVVPEVIATGNRPSWFRSTIWSKVRPLSRSGGKQAKEKSRDAEATLDTIQKLESPDSTTLIHREILEARLGEEVAAAQPHSQEHALQESELVAFRETELELKEKINDNVPREDHEQILSEVQATETGTNSRILTMINHPGRIVNSSSHSSTPAPDLAVAVVEENSEKSVSRGQINAPGFFQGSEHLTFNQPHMFDVETQNVYVQNERSEEALRWLKEYTMQGAEFDSVERDPPPRCHPGTRTTIIQNAAEWLDNYQREKRLFWLRGPAGVGKSAIIQTLAEKLAESNRLGASLFFSRPNRRTNPNQVFPTIAYQIAIQDPFYREYVAGLMQKNPKSLEKALNEQFRILIVEPFVQRKIRDGSDVWVITLDGLDECGSDPDPAGRSSDRVQCDFVRMISSFVLSHPSVPLIWIIASRPETHLKAVFDDDLVRPSFWEEDVPVNSDEACLDVEKYLHSEFARIQKEYPSHIEETPWPSHIHFLRITTAASGLFIFAETVIRFIDSSSARNPVGQLACVLAALQRTAISHDNPLAALDLIYTEILSRAPKDMLQVAKCLIGSLIFLERDNRKGERRTFRDICNFLDVSKDQALTSLSHLHSVLHFAKNMGTAPPRFYHASFRDYLQDPSRSQEYAIAAQDVGIDFFLGSVRLTAAALAFKGVEQAWPVEGSSIGWTIDNAKDQFRAILTGDLSSGTGIGIKFFTTRFVIPDDHLQSFFETLNISKMIQIDTGGLWWPLDLTEAMTEELQRRKFLTRVSLGSLGLKKEDITESFVYAHPHRHVLIHLDRRKPGPERLVEPDRVMVDTLLQCIQAAPETQVTIWGYSDPAKRCVVMKVEDLRQIWPSDGPRLRPFFITGL